MAKARKFRLILTGPMAGKSGTLNGYTFKDGVLELHGTLEQVEGVVNYMGKSYQAYLEGSDELKAAQERDKAAAKPKSKKKESGNGQRGVQGSNQQGAGEDPAASQPGSDGGGSPETTPDDERGGDGAEAGSEGRAPEGDGHPNSGISGEPRPTNGGAAENVKLRDAVLQLDPDNDAHWTKAGAPMIEAVQAMYGADVTRRDIVETVGEWDREDAQNRALEELSG